MDKKQKAILDSFQNTDLTLEGGNIIWAGLVKFANNVKEYRDQLADILKYKFMQVTDVGGARLFKEGMRKDMAEKSVKVRSAVQNFASDTGNVLLYQQVRFAKSKLLYGTVQNSLSYANVIEQHAREHIALLAPYMLTVAELDAYKASIVAFEAAAPMVDQLIDDRKNATDMLKKLFPQTRTTVETKLRPGATQFMETAPDFYNKLIESFSINNYPTHFSEFDIMIKDAATKQGIGGVKVTATSAKGTMQQFSNPVGAADFMQFEPSWWDITYECAGYEVLTMKNVKSELGKKINLTAELVKI